MTMLTGTLEAISSSATWQDVVEIFDDDDGEPWFLESDPPDDIVIKLRDRATQTVVVTGSLSGGEIVVIDDGVIEFTISADVMSNVLSQTYDCGILYEDDGFKAQLFLGYQPVVNGL